MARIVLDTDVASLSYKGLLPMPLAARLIGHEACVTFITIGELARWAEKRPWGMRARSELARWLSNTIVLPYDERVAWKWGQLSVAAERRGRARPPVAPGSATTCSSATTCAPTRPRAHATPRPNRN